MSDELKIANLVLDYFVKCGVTNNCLQHSILLSEVFNENGIHASVVEGYFLKINNECGTHYWVETNNTLYDIAGCVNISQKITLADKKDIKLPLPDKVTRVKCVKSIPDNAICYGDLGRKKLRAEYKRYINGGYKKWIKEHIDKEYNDIKPIILAHIQRKKNG
jgi:hypothetical protein